MIRDNRLLRHDFAVCSATLRHSLRDRANLLTLLLGAPVLIWIARAWIGTLPQECVDVITGAASFLAAFALTRVIAERARYHRNYGVLAASGLRRQQWQLYVFTALGIGLLASLAIVLMTALAAAAWWLIGSVAGLIVGLLWLCVATRLRQITRVQLLSVPSPRLRRNPAPLILASAGLVTGLGCLLLPPQLAAVAAALVSAGAGLWLGWVDPGAVRYMAMTGHSANSVLGIHLQGPVLFLLPLVLVLLAGADLPVALIGAGIALVMFMLITLLTLAYRAFTRRLAEWAATAIVAVAVSAGLAMPMAAPVVLLAGALWLYRRGRHADWLIL